MESGSVVSGREFLGPYRMVRLIRAGASCQVWEAIREGKRVAIKYLQPEVRLNKEEVAYLRHELEVGRQLCHPNVIEMFDFGIDRSIAYLVMEYHPGKNIKMLIRQGLDTFAYMTHQIILDAAAGLKHMHEQGWVHRDVKPDNFLVNDEGEVKLIDFALAHRIRTGLSKLFASRGKVQGTRSYMAPEQIRGKALDARADVYSLGCSLYELVSGRLPFTGVSPEDLLRKHLSAPTPVVAALNKNVTPDFSDLVGMMMAKEPDQRPQSMEEFLRYFNAIRLFRTTPRPPSDAGKDLSA